MSVPIPQASVQMSTLCADCSDLLALHEQGLLSQVGWQADEEKNGSASYKYMKNLTYGELRIRLAAGRDQGCQFCPAALECVPSSKFYKDDSEADCHWELFREDDTIQMLTFHVAGEKKEFHISLASDDHVPVSKFEILPESDADFASTANLQLASKWLQDCEQEHPQCIIPQGKYGHPTRLLEIDDSDPSHLRLLETAGMHVEGYAALSYCWGKGQFLRTFKSNITNLRNGIDIATLSTTVTDAMKVTQRLGIRYLWVDALCIIQDSAEDMKRELTIMSDIYRGSRITIVAASAANQTEGFLTRRVTPKVHVRAPLTIEGKQVGHILVRNPRDVFDVEDALDPTETRAWCLQEGVLSHRTLVFSSLRTVWMCHEIAYARRGFSCRDAHDIPGRWRHPDALTAVHVPYLLDMHLMSKVPVLSSGKQHGSPLSSADQGTLFDFWSAIVRKYSARKLSYQDDKFRAISAIVSEIHALSGDVYCAGIWRSDCYRSMLWHRRIEEFLTHDSSETTQTNTSRSYVAPTWSWISAPGALRLNDTLAHGFNPRIKVIDVNAQPADPTEPFGAVISGTLTLECRVVSVNYWQDGNRWYLERGLPPGASDDEVAAFDADAQNCWGGSHPPGYYEPRLFFDRSRNEDGTLWIEHTRDSRAALCLFEVLHEYEKEWNASQGWLLVRTGNPREFKRVGTYTREDYFYWDDGIEDTRITIV